ncbi:MAG TPA: anthranilate synthase component I family protein [Candidatus Limnocylindria bacterium]|nr:anthranilate synthase component I family protein [Candidatus Limnocylindria bacterium]
MRVHRAQVERRLPPGVRLAEMPGLAGEAPMDVAEWFRDLPGLVLFESARPGRNARWSYLTADPVAVLETAAEGSDPFASARRLLRRVTSDGLADREVPPFLGGLAGFLGYDLGRRFERIPSIARADQELPAMRLALHDWVIAWDRRDRRAWLGGRAIDERIAGLDRRLSEVRERLAAGVAGVSRGAGPVAPPASIDVVPPGIELRSGLNRAAFEAGVESIRASIERGDIYQANLTRRLAAPFRGDAWPLYRRLRTGDPSLFAAFVDLGASPITGAPRAIASASPEPFLSVTAAGAVEANPIKGTRPRGRDRDDDRRLARELLASEKDRAENVMIVDVLRNDLGRVCSPGSVRVPRLCRLERTAAVQHLVSTVTGRLAPGRDAFDLLAASFPGGSITGAPKIRAMEILEHLEPVRRGPYTGIAGWLGPDGAMASSILIRTFVADGERLSLHVGGGITWQSDPAAEWDETVAKARGPLGAIGAREVA